MKLNPKVYEILAQDIITHSKKNIEPPSITLLKKTYGLSDSAMRLRVGHAMQYLPEHICDYYWSENGIVNKFK